MKKNIQPSEPKNGILNEENFQTIIFEIINDVIVKRKEIHLKYDELIKKLWSSKKRNEKKSVLARYIMARVLRESDKAFIEAQVLAKQLCPNCQKNFSNYANYSEEYH